MILYAFRCSGCGNVFDAFKDVNDNQRAICPNCRNIAMRAMDKERKAMRGDIPPHFNESLGVNIGSRREWRDALAKHNAHDPDLMINSNPSAGRLMPEEREEVLKGTVFDSHRGHDIKDEESRFIDVEGEANYSDIIKMANEEHAKKKGR